ncbi:MAG: glutamate synthase subunit beta [Myxococcales bacterium]|nr:glutamate synthase subunit beta [Myxococcales bacterium]
MTQKHRGFLDFRREVALRRPVLERLQHYHEFEETLPLDKLQRQGARCMACGVPFCHGGCPLGNLIPEWNDATSQGNLERAALKLHATNNFPEILGRVCPAPCEEACVLNINDVPVTIKQIERHIGDFALQGGLKPQPAPKRTGYRVAIVGSGPAGLACAQQLARAGHDVTVFERDSAIGGLLRFGIPDFKLEKHILDQRLAQLAAEGVEFRPNVEVGKDVTLMQLRGQYHAVCLAVGATRPRDLPIEGRQLSGIVFAMEYLTRQNLAISGSPSMGDRLSAQGKRVVILGGGDTGSDCLGTALRQGAVSVVQLELFPQPPATKTAEMPWPWYPMVFRTSTSQEEGGERKFAIHTSRFVSDGAGRVQALETNKVRWVRGNDGTTRMEVIPESTETIPADLVLLAMGFVGVEPGAIFDEAGVQLTPKGTVGTDNPYQTNVEGIFCCGDARRGQSLVVWAVWEGRQSARQIDQWLQGRSFLPTAPGPLPPVAP